MTAVPLNNAVAGLSGHSRRTEVVCTHCSLPVPAGLVENGAEHQFCCNGCRTAYGIIHSCGLEAYYRVRDAADAERLPARSLGSAFAEFDDPAFASLYVTPVLGAGGVELRETRLYLPAVHCAACVWLVEKLPMLTAGVIDSRLDFRHAVVTITWDPSRVGLSVIARTLDSLGYTPHPAKEAAARDLRAREDRRFLVRIGVAGAIAGNIMLLAFALYAGAFGGMETQFQQFFRWLSFAFGAVSLAWPGRSFFIGAIAAIRTRTPHLDLPIALGLSVGGIAGAINTVRGSGEIYFDSLSVLVFALLVGRWIQHRQQRWSSDAVELLFSLTPHAAHRVNDDGRIEDVSVQALRAGDVVEVRAGESVPADGVVTAGASSVDESLLSGESRPVEVAKSSRVCAGAVNVAAAILVRVEASGEDTRVARLMRMVADAGSRRARIVRLADRFAVWFVIAMLTLASLTLVVWLFRDPAHAAEYATALLIVTCPCALGLATPLAMTVALGRAARRGMLVKGADALEQLARPGVIVLDKTGTLTQGGVAVVRWWEETERDGVKEEVVALESQSSHPIARALVGALRADRGSPIATEVVQTTGGGIAGRVNGARYAIGSPEFVRPHAAEFPQWAVESLDECRRSALSPVCVVADGSLVAIAGLGDAVRPDSRDSVAQLRSLGWKPLILSGDDESVVRAVAAELGISDADAHGRVSPEEKARFVKELAGSGPVVMVGDGVNDAAALAGATVGIAVHGGAEASLAAADIYLSRPGLSAITELIGASRRTLRTIRRAFAVSIFYNAIAATAAVTGYVNPILAAVLMPLSSFTVLTIAYRSRTFGRAPISATKGAIP
jgi:Cu2+-exporting ATPase